LSIGPHCSSLCHLHLMHRFNLHETLNPAQLQCGPMPNVMATQPNIGGALCKSSVIPFLVPRRKSPRKCIYSVPAQETARDRAKFGWPPVSDIAADEAKTRNPLKFAGVPQTPELISAVSGPKFPILWGHLEKILLFNKSFFQIVDTCLSCKDSAGECCVIVRRWQFLRNFCIRYLQRASCSTFRTCILNLH